MKLELQELNNVLDTLNQADSIINELVEVDSRTDWDHDYQEVVDNLLRPLDLIVNGFYKYYYEHDRTDLDTADTIENYVNDLDLDMYDIRPLLEPLNYSLNDLDRDMQDIVEHTTENWKELLVQYLQEEV